MFVNKISRSSDTFVRIVMLVTLTSIIGCAPWTCNADRCADIPPGAVPEPAGAKVCQWQTAQVTGALVDQTVLYQADFIGPTERLSPSATERMARNTVNGLASVQPTLIEPSGDVELDRRRVDAVTARLVQAGVPEVVVRIATPAALGLSGPQAERVAGGFGRIRGSSTGTGAPISQPSGLGGRGFNSPGGFF